jgi:alkylhydroperoxidase family enzyme
MDKIHELPTFRTSALFDERERLALELGERMTIAGQSVDDEFFACLRRHFSEAEVVELVAIAGFENMRSRMNIALGVAAQGFCVLDAASPAAAGAGR